MNKADMGDRLAGRPGSSKPVTKDAVAVCSRRSMRLWQTARRCGLRVSGRSLPGAGRARTGRNLQTGEMLFIPAWKTPSFKARKALRDTVNDG